MNRAVKRKIPVITAIFIMLPSKRYMTIDKVTDNMQKTKINFNRKGFNGGTSFINSARVFCKPFKSAAGFFWKQFIIILKKSLFLIIYLSALSIRLINIYMKYTPSVKRLNITVLFQSASGFIHICPFFMFSSRRLMQSVNLSVLL